MFQQHDLVMVADEAEAGVSGGAGLAPADQKGAGRLLQCLDPLADGGGGDMQFRRRKVEGAPAMDGGQGGKLGGIEH